MSKNDITGDRLVSRANTKSFDENFDRIFSKKDDIEALRAELERPCCGTFHGSPHRSTCQKGKCQHDWCFDGEDEDGNAAYFSCCLCGEEKVTYKEPPHTCLFCGAPSWYDPSDQSPPPDYCHESDHGEPE